MDTLTTAWLGRHATFWLTSTRALDVIDLTDRVTRFVAIAGLGIGVVNVQTLHTTTAVVVNEAEPLLLDDFRDLLETLAPQHRGWRHDDLSRRFDVPVNEPLNGHAHGKALLLPTSALLNVVDGRLMLGHWQRVLFADLDGPRVRQVSLVATGTAR